MDFTSRKEAEEFCKVADASTAKFDPIAFDSFLKEFHKKYE